MKKIIINSLGCPKNLVDSEIIAASLKNHNYVLVSDPKQADIGIINTCAFIEPAVEEAIDAILEFGKYKEDGSMKKIVVAGCLVERYKEEVLDKMPEVDLCIGIDGYKDIATILDSNERQTIYGKNIDSSFMNSPRLLSSKKASAYVKISEGCDNRCTYCTIPFIRGKFRSRSIEDIVFEVEDLCNNKGIKEITLVAQDTTAYGKDIYGQISLCALLRRLEKIENLKWIRLLYCYPELIDDELIELMKKSKKLLHYLDIPLQHASNKILKLMGRKGSWEQYNNLIDKLRKNIDDIVIRSTFIVGFAQETKEDFYKLCDFLERNRFDRAGFFSYFKEEGSAAYNLDGHIEEEIKLKRLKKCQALQQNIMLEKNQERIGKIYQVLVEGVSPDGLFYSGRSYGEAKEIDPIIYIASKEELVLNEFIQVKIVGLQDENLVAEVL